MNLYSFIAVFLFVCISSAIYFFIASKLNMYDNPGGRSSHTSKTITGYGLIFFLTIFFHQIFIEYSLPLNFLIGLGLLSVISFLDDLFFIKHSVRFGFQIVGLSLLASVLPITGDLADKVPVWIAIVFFGIGVLNGFNFMDGINGMLGLNSFVIILSLFVINENLVNSERLPEHFVSPDFLIGMLILLGVFLFFNLRSNAKCFMGDVGSIGISFTILFLIYTLVSKTGNFSYLLLFSVLGIDSGLTVFYKLIQKENLFVPHRDFLFKKLVHIGKFGHVRVSVFYAVTQAVVNASIIFLPFNKSYSSQMAIVFIWLTIQTAAFIYFRSMFQRKRVWFLKNRSFQTEKKSESKTMKGKPQGYIRS